MKPNCGLTDILVSLDAGNSHFLEKKNPLLFKVFCYSNFSAVAVHHAEFKKYMYSPLISTFLLLSPKVVMRTFGS